MEKPPPVLSKTDMYERLARGEFGNSIRQFFFIPDWAESDDFRKYPVWGVRTLTPGGPCRLNCPRDEVLDTALGYRIAGHQVNISMMVDTVATVTAWLEVWDSPLGLVVEGIEYPRTPEWTWRNSMPDPTRRKRWEGIAARHVLARHLNENSRDDLAILLDQYPDHIIEMSSLDRCIGTVPHRNHVVWESRLY